MLFRSFANSAQASRARNVYESDVTIGELPNLRGHWLDRLPAIEEDISALEKKLAQAGAKSPPRADIAKYIQEVLGRPHRRMVSAHHTSPGPFHAGDSLEIEIAPKDTVKAIQLFYRRVNQGERFQMIQMERNGNAFAAKIPAAYTDSPYALQYYFEIRQDSGNASLYPGFVADLTNQPYFVVRQA